MTDPRRSREAADADPGTGGARPRWPVLVGIVIAIALLGLMVALHVTGLIGPGVH